jgi:hypothetical protein
VNEFRAQQRPIERVTQATRNKEASGATHAYHPGVRSAAHKPVLPIRAPSSRVQEVKVNPFRNQRWMAAIALMSIVLGACSSAATTPTPAASVAAPSAAAPSAAPSAAAPSAAPSASAAAVDLTGKKVGVIELYNNPYWVDAVKGVKQVFDPLGITTSPINSNGEPQTQATNVTNFISAAVAGIIMGPVSPTGAVADAQRIKDANIPLVCGDSCLPDDQAQGLAKGWRRLGPWRRQGRCGLHPEHAGWQGEHRHGRL